ncbi:AMP-binding protein [uncultured Clostridium sp.]|uniref:AMP-binding protein n=1 Tax=uncultured Clostridium sp. TaxID=59620 RepID=UPI0026131749|nr:AMP-binding protein [uncultured Clostridium sp.]
MEREKYFEATEFHNIKELMYDSVQKYNEKTAFIIKHKDNKEVSYENISYTRLLEEINHLGTKFYALGYQNKRIAVIGRNRYEWVITHLTNLLGGILSIPLDKELQVDELESCFIRSKADVVVFDEKYKENIEEIRRRGNAKIESYICMSEQEGYLSIPELKKQGKQILESGNKEYLEAEIDSYKMNVLLFTSGTTSKSKAVMLSQNNIASNVYSMQLVEDIRKEDVNIAFLPFHHIFGSTCMVVMLAFGVTTAFPDGLRYIAQNLKEYKVSIFVGVPLLVEAIYKRIEKGIEKQGKAKTVKIAKKISNILLKLHIDIRKKLFKQILDELGGHMRFVISGGAPLDKKVAQGFNELGIHVVQGYGLTETSPVIAAENYKKMKYGSIGFPMENVELQLVNQDEQGVGEIRVKGPNVMLGYYENEEATKEVLKDGWFYTGDLAYFDKEGYLFLAGRKKDMIVLKNGKKVFPDELETLVNRIEEVKECIVYGMPDNKDKNDIKLSVKIVYDKEVTDEKYPEITSEELENIIWQKIKQINKTFPPYKYIKNMILTDQELIKTTTQKVKRNEEIKNLLKQ